MEKLYLTNFVTKAGGARQLFDKKKIMKTCLRMGATRRIAEEIAEEIAANIYDGIETSKILQMIFKRLSKRKTSARYQICLRRALSLMNPYDFERFIQMLLSEHGYEVTQNQIIRGRCVEHEVDAVARKNNKTYIVEIKHHYKYHTPTGLDESRIARAVFEDLTEGFRAGLNNVKIDKPLIICNTKFSEHARRYAECRGIHKIGWSSPPNRGLQTMIEEKKFYPVPCLRGVNEMVRERLASNGIILLSQLAATNPKELAGKMKISSEKLARIVDEANMVISNTNS
jgi:hypothetical protein